MSETPAIYGQFERSETSLFQPLPRNRLSRFLKRQSVAHILGESIAPPEGVAIYTLSDPRDIRSPRYVGQTGSPERRWFQHVNTARLWMPDEIPWWVRSPRLRPLYDWIRALHRDEYRLPFMLITQWVGTVSEARSRERALILESIAQQKSLLNVEATCRHR